jgi:phosphotransferase family enzyme
MDRTNAEIPLVGGRITPGVVRIGDTVRRPPRLNAEFIRAVLEHLAAVGFEAAPRFLGTDEKGRDILTYIDGEVPRDLGWHDDAILVAAAKLIRRYHDATVDLIGSGSSAFEVVCHNDLSPCNFVFNAGTPIALIDFDTAAPGTRRMDVGYAAWTWLDLGDDDVDVSAAEQRRRFKLFAASYDDKLDTESIKQAVLQRQAMLAAEGESTGKEAKKQRRSGRATADSGPCSIFSSRASPAIAATDRRAAQPCRAARLPAPLPLRLRLLSRSRRTHRG